MIRLASFLRCKRLSEVPSCASIAPPSSLWPPSAFLSPRWRAPAPRPAHPPDRPTSSRRRPAVRAAAVQRLQRRDERSGGSGLGARRPDAQVPRALAYGHAHRPGDGPLPLRRGDDAALLPQLVPRADGLRRQQRRSAQAARAVGDLRHPRRHDRPGLHRGRRRRRLVRDARPTGPRSTDRSCAGSTRPTPTNIKVVGDAKLGGWVQEDRVVGNVLYAVSQDEGWTYGWATPGVAVGVANGGGVAVASPGTTFVGGGGSNVIVSSVSFGGGQIAQVASKTYAGYGGVFAVTPSSIMLAHPDGPPQPDGGPTSDHADRRCSTSTSPTPAETSSSEGCSPSTGSSTPRPPTAAAGTSTSPTGRRRTSSVRRRAPRAPPGPRTSSPRRTSRTPTSPSSTPSSPSRRRRSMRGGPLRHRAHVPVPRLVVHDSDGHPELHAPRRLRPHQPGGPGARRADDAPRRRVAHGPLRHRHDPLRAGQRRVADLAASRPHLPRRLDRRRADRHRHLDVRRGVGVDAGGRHLQGLHDEPDAGYVVLPFSGWDAAAGDYDNGVQLIEYSPSKLETAGAAYTKGWVERGIFVNNRIVSLTDLALAVVDYSNPLAPQVTAELTLARNVVAAQPEGSTIAEVSSDWWDNDVTQSDVRVLPVSDAAENLDESQRGRRGRRGRRRAGLHERHARLRGHRRPGPGPVPDGHREGPRASPPCNRSARPEPPRRRVPRSHCSRSAPGGSSRCRSSTCRTAAPSREARSAAPRPERYYAGWGWSGFRVLRLVRRGSGGTGRGQRARLPALDAERRAGRGVGRRVERPDRRRPVEPRRAHGGVEHHHQRPDGLVGRHDGRRRHALHEPLRVDRGADPELDGRAEPAADVPLLPRPD